MDKKRVANESIKWNKIRNHFSPVKKFWLHGISGSPGEQEFFLYAL